MNPPVETKFISLDNKESSYVKVDMPDLAVFYPYFHFKAAKSVELTRGKSESKSFKVYRVVLEVKDKVLDKIDALEKSLFPGRPDEYGFWTGKNSEGHFIGLGAGSLRKFFEKPDAGEATLVVLQGEDLLFVFNIKKNLEGLVAKTSVYFSDVEVEYGEKIKAIDLLLTFSEITDAETVLNYELDAFSFNKYSYSGKGASLQKVCDTHVVLPEHEKKPFKDNVEVCTWHTIVFNDNVVNEGPRFVLLKNPGLSLNSSLDKLSCWLVHRRGGFVMGEEFASNDFHQETTFTIREVDEYVFDGLSILNVECDTYTKNRDSSFESFLKNLSPARFNKV